MRSAIPLLPVEAVTECLIDYRGKTPPKTEAGVRLITAKVIKHGQILSEPAEYIDPDFYDEWMRRGLPQDLDVLITTEAPLGEVALLRLREPVALAQRVILLRANQAIVDPVYLFYALQSDLTRADLHARSTGTTVSGIKQSELRQVRIPVPLLSEQRRIAGILSAYDDLIENCERRIRVLDEMARALYREWFVLFRYPGHEKTPLVESPLGRIPKGWHVESLQDGVGTIQDGDWIETKDQGGNDFRLVQISNVGVGCFVETGNYRYVTAETFSRLRCTEVVPGDILVARMPTPIGRAWLVTPQPWRMITAVDVAIVRTNPTQVLSSYFVQAWNDGANLRRIAAQASGTTRPRVTRRELAALSFVVPPIALQREFESRLAPIAELVENLRARATTLRKTRDLLLPRLLSGQLSAMEDAA
jgi:type I restriction enzyme S subunit